MSDEIPKNLDLHWIARRLVAIQRELADMQDDRIVTIAILQRLDATTASYIAEMRALRSQFDRFRGEVREKLAE
jgi:hypothetical protein